jgi:assimilatory nitrate reductase catalytic subunit
MLHVLISQRWLNERFIRAHTENWEQVYELTEAWSPARAAKICGIAETDIHRAAFWFGQSAEALSLWTMGRQSKHQRRRQKPRHHQSSSRDGKNLSPG